jgi:hypothetical protein
MDVCLLCVCQVARSLRRADHSSRGVLPTVVRHCVWSRNLKNEEAKTRKWVVKASKRKKESISHTLLKCKFEKLIQVYLHSKKCNHNQMHVIYISADINVIGAKQTIMWQCMKLKTVLIISSSQVNLHAWPCGILLREVNLLLNFK